MARAPWCPMQDRPGDHILGEGSTPESVADDASQFSIELPVPAGQQICQGDVVTRRNGGIVRVESAADSGDGMNWGDVSGGAYVALESVDTMSPRSGSGRVRVLSSGARIVSILDAGATLGSRMGVDLRAMEEDRRVDRKDPVTCLTDHSLDSRLWQRTRVMSEEDMRDGVRKKAFLGRLEEVITGNAPFTVQSAHGDYGRILVRPQFYA